MTSKPRRSRSRLPKAALDDRLLAAMERLLENGQGFSAITVEELAREAGISRATFYLHFRDRGELVAHLMRRLTEDVVGSAGDWFAARGQSGPQTVKQALRGIVTTFHKHHAIVSAVAAMAGQDETVARLHEDMMRQLCERSRRALAAVKADTPPGDVSWDSVADVLTWCVEQYCARFAGQCDPVRLDALIDTFAHICNSAIFSPDQSRAR
ncbi:TetR/AcrR family transcriptional regulator [Castellaniella defragrans]|uniref:AcrR family transcriptional regulator n=1 Tax=Castellaniella defragrans TaxID=75697 RepID=A0A7W9TR18_CASDE|nr:TetR/AcrR family transcriptional regulator [Castellaniella defragrans]KAB0622731.1 TetR/AcrR family transcriptional regulator [Castellaniella defragrans]MBB6085254.1 AcrR family transcriptional regulator [Castellaniella defragrans]